MGLSIWLTPLVHVCLFLAGLLALLGYPGTNRPKVEFVQWRACVPVNEYIWSGHCISSLQTASVPIENSLCHLLALPSQYFVPHRGAALSTGLHKPSNHLLFRCRPSHSKPTVHVTQPLPIIVQDPPTAKVKLPYFLPTEGVSENRKKASNRNPCMPMNVTSWL